MDARNSNQNSDVITIKDPEGLLWVLAGVVFFGLVTLYSLTEFAMGGIIFGGGATYLFYLAYKVLTPIQY